MLHTEEKLHTPLIWEFFGGNRYLQAAISKSIATLYAAKFDSVTSRALSISAAEDGFQELVAYSRDIGCRFGAEVCTAAAAHGHFDLLIWLHENGCALNDDVSAAAASFGSLVMLEWIRGKGAGWLSSTPLAAARAGHLHILDYCKANACPFKLPVLCSEAALNGHQHVLQWAVENSQPMENALQHAENAEQMNDAELMQDAHLYFPFPWDSESTAKAAEGGHMDLLLWLKAQGCPLSVRVCELASKSNQLHILEWATSLDPPVPFSEKCCSWSAFWGHLRVLQWLREHGCPWDSDTCAWAAKGNQFEVLRWAHENGAEMGAATCAYSAELGNLEILKYARANGAPWDKRTRMWANRAGHSEIVSYAIANGCPATGPILP